MPLIVIFIGNMMSDEQSMLQRPILVKTLLWGITSRRVAQLSMWLSVILAAVAINFKLWVGGSLLLLLAVGYGYSIKWMDKNSAWSFVPKSKASKIVLWVSVFVVIGLIASKAFIGSYHIPQNGMYPNLPADSTLFILKHPYQNASDVKRGDIVVFVQNQDGKAYNYIWRVIALPGETVEASGDTLKINGQTVSRQRLSEADGKTIFLESSGDTSYEIAVDASPTYIPPDISITVPSDQFFVMGDNRFDAVDSRYFGPIYFDSIIGKKL